LYGERFERGMSAVDDGRRQPSEKAVAYESDVSDGVQVTVLF